MRLFATVCGASHVYHTRVLADEMEGARVSILVACISFDMVGVGKWHATP